MGGICLITFSNNADHQNVIYSMFHALAGKADVYTIGIENPKSLIAPKTERNYYFHCPERPGVQAGTFRVDVLLKIAGVIKKLGIQYLYFESVHVWNLPLMLLCPRCVRVEAVHDVVPHDKSRGVEFCTKLLCKCSDHIILRNQKYQKLLSQKYGVPESKITPFEPWRDFPEESPVVFSHTFLCFGRIRKYKGLEQLEKVIRKLPETRFRIVGKPDAESREIVDILRRYPNAEITDREVTDDEMACCFHEADWVILPYSSASQSGVIADAYRFSRPVIVFDVGAIGEQVEDGVTGFLIEPGNIDAFADAIRNAERMDEEELRRFAHNAYAAGHRKYAAEAVAERFWETIRSLQKTTPYGRGESG